MSVLELCLTSGGSGKKMRGVKMDGGEERWSVYDFINVVCEKPENNAYARVTFGSLIADTSEYKDEVVRNLYNLKFPGRGQRDTPCMTLKGLQTLLAMLGGKVAAEYRALVVDTFNRVMAGDRSLIQVIESNAQSAAPVQQAFKRALAQEPVDKTLDRMCGVKHTNDIDERSLLEDLRIKQIKRVQDHAAAYATLCPDGKLDDRARVMFKDQMLNLCIANNEGPSGVMLVTNNVGSGNPLTISHVASNMGLVLSSDDLQEAGFKVAKAYKAKYGMKPTKHDQICGGAVRSVNSYTEKDRGLVEEVLQGFVRPIGKA
jgi:hypothetical protein